MTRLKEISLQTPGRLSFIEITSQVEAAVRESGVQEGSIIVFVPHTTAAVTINENADPDVIHDLKGILQQLVPWVGPYKHGEGNSAAHMMASLVGSSETVIIHKGRLLLGTWQGLYLTEFDGPRSRKVILRIQED
ncbi:YjbQ family protein [Heliobacillus mobilis]|uniref:YjbQ family protein n=1 Tax=Heliobacterium mobile TaxID=28064 RepID=A0A6I3SD74_HELMO|nr:secondary thiamine-phosphate synthase enzyme YjbQ [Heliobacterium mobile]MTV47525.1 YjbQ family protein [Heliobacterium mobile]